MANIGNRPGVASQRLVKKFYATAGQTTFQPEGGYIIGNLDVIVNGIDLKEGVEFTATDGINVLLTTPATLGAFIKTVAYIPRGLSDGYTKTEADVRFRNQRLSVLNRAAAVVYVTTLDSVLSVLTRGGTTSSIPLTQI